MTAAAHPIRPDAARAVLDQDCARTLVGGALPEAAWCPIIAAPAHAGDGWSDSCLPAQPWPGS